MNKNVDILAGNLSLIQIAEIANKNRLRIAIPATLIVGQNNSQNTRDRLIYTDPRTGLIVVEQKPIILSDVGHFIDEQMAKKERINQTIQNLKNRSQGTITPNFIVKFVDKLGYSDARVYFDKHILISDIVDRWGTCDIFLQEFLI